MDRRGFFTSLAAFVASLWLRPTHVATHSASDWAVVNWKYTVVVWDGQEATLCIDGQRVTTP